MRTFLLTLLLAILPLQFAWGAATGYCRHQANASSGEKSKDLKQKTIADSDDCIGCHASVAYIAPVLSLHFLAPVGGWPPALSLPTYRSPIPIGLERPARTLAL